MCFSYYFSIQLNFLRERLLLFWGKNCHVSHIRYRTKLQVQTQAALVKPWHFQITLYGNTLKLIVMGKIHLSINFFNFFWVVRRGGDYWILFDSASMRSWLLDKLVCKMQRNTTWLVCTLYIPLNVVIKCLLWSKIKKTIWFPLTNLSAV